MRKMKTTDKKTAGVRTGQRAVKPGNEPISGAGPSVHIARIATLYQAIQRDRVGLERSLAMKPEVYDPEAKAMYEDLVKLEENTVRYLDVECRKSPVWARLSQVKGIGPRLAGMLIGLIEIEKCPTVSALWRYAGLAVIDGHAERRVKGEKLHYNHLLKKTCFLIARQFVMGGTEPYLAFYYEAKAAYQAGRPEWMPGHCDYAARRKMVKLFLSHLWEVWRAAAGLPGRVPYAQTLPGHEGGYRPSPW